jgi:hypothetical protein
MLVMGQVLLFAAGRRTREEEGNYMLVISLGSCLLGN